MLEALTPAPLLETPKALPDEETQVAYTEAVNRLFRLREDDAPGSTQDPTATPANRRK